MAYWQITNDQLERFGRDGFLLVPNLLNDQETENLVAACRGDRKIRDEVVFDHADPSGKPVQLTAWNHPGDDIYGTISRCERIVNAIERMLLLVQQRLSLPRSRQRFHCHRPGNS